MIKSGFFPSKNGDRRYGHSELNKPLLSLLSDGVIPNRGDALQVMANDDDTIRIMSGMAHCYGHWLENTAVEVMSIPQSDYVYDRIDRVVIRCDETEDVRDMYIYIKQGKAQLNPVPPSLERTDAVKEMCLAEILVKKQANQVSQSNITDTRADTKICGWVTGLIDKVDTSTLYEQWKKAYQEYYDKTQANIDGWFSNIKENLNGIGVLREYKKKIDIPSQATDTFTIDVPMFNYDLDILNVYINGIRLNDDEFRVQQSSSNGFAIILNETVSSTNGDILEISVMRSIDDIDIDIVHRFETELMEQKQQANDIVNEIKRKLQAGELKGDPGSRTLYGSGIPSSSNGNVGDWYYDTASEKWDVYYKSSAQWVKMGQIKGELGGDTVPIGSMLPCVSNIIPSGWLLCNGALISRSEYSELFSIIGEAYGAGDGSTTFALPNEPNPLTYTQSGSDIQLASHEPSLHMIIKAKQVIPVVGGIENSLESANPATNAPSIEQVNLALQQLIKLMKENKTPNSNLIVNGDFQIWQRGSSFDSTKANGYTADRWFMSRSASVKAKTTINNSNGLNIIFNSSPASGESVQFDYYFAPEETQQMAGKTVTLSLKKTGGEVRIQARIKNGNNYTSLTNFAASAAGYATFTMPSYKSGDMLDIVLNVSNTSTIHYVKLEEGTIVTPLPYVPYSQVLLECQRYYQKVAFNYSTYCHDFSYSIHNSLFLKVAMRAVNRINTVQAGELVNVKSINYAYQTGGAVRFNVEPSATGFMRAYNVVIELEGELIA